MNSRKVLVALLLALCSLCCILLLAQQKRAPSGSDLSGPDKANLDNALDMVNEGRRIFRFDTFGSEGFWGDALHLHEAIAGNQQGGVGPGVSPKTALAVGLKVDVDALPADLVAALKAGKVNLDDPATTLALLKLNAVVGVTGFFDPNGRIKSMGIQCALCHSTVDDSLTGGIGHRLDGWANRDLNVGAIKLTPAMISAVKPSNCMSRNSKFSLTTALDRVADHDCLGHFSHRFAHLAALPLQRVIGLFLA